MIPITILTGFLGAGKTTILKQILEKNKDKKIGLIINEFGEVGIDGQIVQDSGQEIIELSNGCMCCIVRSDLYKTVEDLISKKNLDYIIIEASGLAEAKPIADTFIMNNLGGKVTLDSVVCVVDTQNFLITQDQFKVASEQLKYCDIVVLNKLSDQNLDSEILDKIKTSVLAINPSVVFLENLDHAIDVNLLIESGKWSIEKLLKIRNKEKSTEKHSHSHTHEHDSVDEVVYIAPLGSVFNPNKLDNWLKTQFPATCVRSKGILKLDTGSDGEKFYLFQMIGASKTLEPFYQKNDTSRIVLIGKSLDQAKIIKDLEASLK
jgi:G3E family GTPase